MKHAEGSGLILKSRFAQGVVPLVATFLAFALAAPEARAAAPAAFAKKMTLTPSTAALAKIGETAWTDFPVLVRLPAAVSSQLQVADGTDLYFEDESEAPLAFEVETFNPDGTTFVWVKVPSLSSATRLTVYFGGSANDGNNPTAVWSRYVGVWHFDADAAGTTTVADATGHALDATTAGDLTAVDGPFGDRCLRSSASTSAPDFESGFAVGATFTASGWFKAPEMTASDYVSPARKKGSTWNAANGWYLELPKDTGKLQIILTGNTPSTTLSDVRSNWHYFEVVSGGGSVKVYLDGETSPKISSTYTIVANSERYSIQAPKVLSDEYRIRAGAASADETALEYATMADAAFFGLGAIEPVDATAQEFETPTAVRNADGTYTVTVVLSENSGDVGVIYDAGAASLTNIIATAANPDTYTDTPANLTAGTTYKFSAYGKNANGTEVVEKGGVFYNGDLSISKISDAYENDLVAGVFRISRADTAHDLTVTYTVGGSAAAGQTYETLSGTATIPAGSSSVDVEVVPLIDAAITEDTTVVLTLNAGLYGIDAQAGSAELTVVNLVAPTGYNTWIATADGLASVDSNWSMGAAPTSLDNVLFDGRFSTANCEWDAAASATVTSWTQTNGYSGVITLKTVYPGKGDFQCLTVTGPMAVMSGTITHPQSLISTSETWLTGAQIQEQEVYRLCLVVGGTFTVGAGGAIDVKDKGHYQALKRDCYGAHAVGYSSLGGAAAYGNPKEPIDIGMGCNGNQWAWVPYPGSGAIRITAGNVVVNGSICADAGSVKYGGHRRFTAAAGSIWIDADSITGTGSITAVAVKPPDGSCGNNGRGSGGSIALWTKTPVALGSPFVSAGAAESGLNAPGTVFLHDQNMDKGVLVIDGMRSGNPPDSRAGVNVTTDADWTFDEVRLQNHGTLSVPAGTTLTLPGGWAGITSTNAVSAANCGVLCYEGGTIDAGTAADVGLCGRWCFTPVSNYVFNANVSLTGGAMIGKYNRALNLGNNLDVWSNATCLCSISVTGNLTVDSSSSLSVSLSGFMQNSAYYFPGYGTSSHGGCYGDTTTLTGGAVAYGSIINPILPARAQSNSYYQPGGGALKLTVGGTLALDGQIVSDGYSGGNGGVRGAGGSLNITAGALTGTGSIHANGLSGESGGRVAVRLTNSGATFDDFKGTITARRDGAAKTAPGTVYLQTAANGEGCGTIIVDGSLRSGTASSVATPYTPIPANGAHADDPADLKKCSLEVSNYARIGIAETLKLASLETDSSSVIDLNGKTFTVKSAKVNGVKLAPGTYTAESTVVIGDGTLGDYLVDTAEDAGGELVVKGGGFAVILR